MHPRMIRVFQRREVADVGELLMMCDIWIHSVNENMKSNFVKIIWKFLEIKENNSVNDARTALYKTRA